MTVPIYQFCRKFDNVRYSDVYKCYVSGGYAFEKITEGNQPIPPVIRQAVINGYFKLNDNYPPEENDFALIAREIDKYSVLAVANRQLDDGGRPTIGYKYFWLEKPFSTIDGIGTLMYWWSEKQPKFKMAELLEKSQSQIFYCRQEEKQRIFPFQDNWLEKISKAIGNLPSIPHTVTVTRKLWCEYPEYVRLHYLALGLSQRANCLNAWAWNVKKIEYPETFAAIFYASSEDIPRDISKHNLPPLPQPNHVLNPTNPSDQNPVGSNSASPETNLALNSTNSNHENSVTVTPENSIIPPVKTPNQIPPATEKKIKSCLSSLANTFNQHGLDDRKIQELFEYLREYADADWSGCIDKNTITFESSADAIYPQLAYLVAPNHKSCENWLLKMVQSLEMPTKKTSQSNNWISNTRNWANPPSSNNESYILEFQRVFLEASYQCENHQVIYKLEDSIYYGISFLLNKLMDLYSTINTSESKILAEKIDYLLITSPSIWSGYFTKFAALIANVTIHKDTQEANNYPSIIEFCKPIQDIISKVKNIPEATRSVSYGKYKILGFIFRKTERKDLAELLYRISGNSGSEIPKDVQNSLSNEIRGEIFGVKTPKIFTRISYPVLTYYKNNDDDDQGDALSNSIIGLVFFLIGSLVFFYTVSNWTGWWILFPIIVLVMFTIIAIAITAYPFKTRNKFSIRQGISLIYFILTVAFLVVSVSPKQPPQQVTEPYHPAKNNICSNESINFLESYQNYECYLRANPKKDIPDEQVEKYIPQGSQSQYKPEQLKLIKSYVSNIKNEGNFKTKIQKLEQCQKQDQGSLEKCLNHDNPTNTSSQAPD